jgi:hypothetical protein
MEDVGPERRHLVVSGLMSAFEKIWVDAWSARMAYILQNTLAALLEYPGATLLGINRMLSDKSYRQKVVDNLTDPTTKAFWTEEFAKYTDRYTQEATPAIQNKVGQFTSNPLIRNIIGQPRSSFDIRKIMDEKKILIVNLSKGLVGENNANLLGSMLVTKIYLAAMSRADASPQDLKKLPNFYLYVDEFQSFANKSFADILSEARKYKLSLNITHQYIEQMAEEVRAAVFGNVGTLISFRVGSYDAEVLEKEFAPVFTAEDLVNLGFVQIYLKLMIDGVASQPFSATTLPPIAKPEIVFKDQVVEASRKNYAHPKALVEEEIKKWHESVDNAGGKAENRQLTRKRDERKEVKRHEERIVEKPDKKIENAENVKKEVVERNEKKSDQKNSSLADAIANALREKQSTADFKKEVVNEKPTPLEVAEKISLSVLKHGEKNKNKEATAENKNALKEALNKVASNQHQADRAEKKEEKSKEVPEDVLRKILKG